MVDRCESHDEIVMAVGQVSVQLGEVHDDVKDIKDVLYKVGNGGSIGWMHRVKGQIRVIGIVLSFVSAVVLLLLGIYLKAFFLV